MLPVVDVLDQASVASLRRRLDEIAFVDGRGTAGPAAQQVKDNMQADPDDPRLDALRAEVRDALQRNWAFRVYGRPARWSRLLFSRYQAGQRYGRHYDNWLKEAEGGGQMRSDLSFTLFLSAPDSYEGGELSLERPEGVITVKMPAGSAFIYPTNVLHQVLPVTAGERVACVGWIQSHVRTEEQREILFGLDGVLAATGEGEPRLVLDKSIGSLLRLWADP